MPGKWMKSAAMIALCCLFAADANDARSGGSLVLAKNVGTEAPPPAPEWLTKLFPDNEQSDRLERRLRRIAAKELDVGGRIAGSVIVELTYPGLDGRDEVGQARVFLPPALRDNPAARVPLVHVAGYEVDEGGAAGLMAKGYAVSTPHAHPLNPLGRGVNLDRAIMHAVRRLPCVDPLRVSIQGGSAGGWMTLMLAADAFPLVWAMPDVPPIHVGYNVAYIAEHQAMAAELDESGKPRLPVLQAVGPIAQQCQRLYGVSVDSAAYLAVSPLAHLDTVTAPTLVTFSTADMLVPIDQVSLDMVRPFDAKLFPEGFSTAMAERFPGVDGKRTLLDALPREQFALSVISPSDTPPRLRADGAPEGAAKPLVLPFAEDRVWSIVVVDEGPVEPMLGHFKYHWTVDHEPFRKWAEEHGVAADQLTARKLERLMRRLRGEPWLPLQVRPGGADKEITGNQLDYPEAERADVLLGLQAFAADDVRAARLAQLYAQLPADLKALGDRLGNGEPADVRAALQTAFAHAPQ